MTEFGTLLKEFRLRVNLTQSELAKRSEITKSYISKLEKGKRDVPSRELALRLSRILKLTEIEMDYWLISAGYISPRMQMIAENDISRLIDELSA
ncbi:MAG: helix-turn-helix domain-containing protein [Candidatus Helarchaeota archaeon]